MERMDDEGYEKREGKGMVQQALGMDGGEKRGQ